MNAAQTAPPELVQLGIKAKKGRLVPLKTKDELRAALETYDVYVVGISAKYAGEVLTLIKGILPDLKTAEFQHLRRVVLPQYLPVHLQAKFASSAQVWQTSTIDDGLTSAAEILPKTKPVELRHLLIAPVSAIELSVLQATLIQKPPFIDLTILPEIFTIPVPALAPTSAEQAAQWSRQYWPISYKNTNPYGPHPSLLARQTAEIEDQAGAWLALSGETGKQVNCLELGESVGCVVVDDTTGISKVIAVAGDCRWRPPSGHAWEREGSGNVMAHAVLRVIAMVAKKRLRATGVDPELPSESVTCDFPLTSLEQRFYDLDNITVGGYLCMDLDIYITHEPCVMCSMAILHSRFRRCIFGKRMLKTGGLTAELENAQGDKPAGLGHGIFWRPSELNWKFLSWEWEPEADADNVDPVEDTLRI